MSLRDSKETTATRWIFRIDRRITMNCSGGSCSNEGTESVARLPEDLLLSAPVESITVLYDNIVQYTNLNQAEPP